LREPPNPNPQTPQSQPPKPRHLHLNPPPLRPPPRAELLLQQPLRRGLATRADCLQHLGAHFRGALGAGPRVSDQAVGEQLLRE
jgi:hypothetical protein